MGRADAARDPAGGLRGVLRGDLWCRSGREAWRNPRPHSGHRRGRGPRRPPGRSESIRDSAPDARLEVLSPAAHLANVERPEAMTGAILDHLQAVVREET